MPFFNDSENNYDAFKKKCKDEGRTIEYVLAKLMKLYTKNPKSIE